MSGLPCKLSQNSRCVRPLPSRKGWIAFNSPQTYDPRLAKASRLSWVSGFPGWSCENRSIKEDVMNLRMHRYAEGELTLDQVSDALAEHARKPADLASVA